MKHIPVLQKEVTEMFTPKANENFIDATLGHGGHAKLILEKTKPKGKLLGIEQDIDAIYIADENLKKYGDRVTIACNNFIQIGLILRKWQVDSIDGILIDLGPNTKQLISGGIRSSSPLDMRMDPTRQKTTAADIINKYSEKDIEKILFAGEEKFGRGIAKKIIISRSKHPIETTNDLIEIVKNAIPPKYRFNTKTHFATDTFRALRMEVNHELENLKEFLPQAIAALSSGGRIAVISFHSLEDRVVKNFFRDSEDIEILTKKPIIATDQEIAINPSARSAKLRVAVKI